MSLSEKVFQRLKMLVGLFWWNLLQTLTLLRYSKHQVGFVLWLLVQKLQGGSIQGLQIIKTPGKIWKKCWIYRFWTVASGQWSRKNHFNHFLTGWNSSQIPHIDVQAEKRVPNICHVRIRWKWRHIVSLFSLSGT